eukprot:TRINITY_DN23985_c0_g1_i1.p1 TRINITY_DN23985_c0_g1~~TRINITY_DN23985_c0_g1_i1.p1  ORF type:complete len:623 (+),score=205.53 TRINITY_DN23985_c0_g1_i1:66-1934(+)
MPPPPSPLAEPKKQSSQPINVEKAQKLFGKSDMFKNKVFAISPSYAKAGRLTATKIILSHGGEVVKPNSEEKQITHFVVPHHTSSHYAGVKGEVQVADAQVVTEDWLSLCFNFHQSLNELEKITSEAAFREKANVWGDLLPIKSFTFTEAVIFVNNITSLLQRGEFLPDPLSHFLYHVPIRKALPGTAKGVAASPFVQHGKLRTAKKEGTGVAVCFSGIPGYQQNLLAKAVELLGGKVTPGYDSHVTTHVVTTREYFDTDGSSSNLIAKARKAAEKGGHKIVVGVTTEWLASSAEAGYFIIETGYVLFPEGAKFVDNVKEEKKQEKDARRSVASSQPTPVVKAVLKDPETPSPRGCLNFDTVARTEVKPKEIRVCFAVSAKSPLMIPAPPVGILETIVEELGGTVVTTCIDATHFVTSTMVTTESTCVAVASGLWIMSPLWVTESGTSGKWKDEEEYEWSHSMVMRKVEEKKLSEVSKEVSRARSLARAVKYWREQGGSAFRGWNIHLCASDAYATILTAGQANIVSRALPSSWKDIEEGFVLLDRKAWDTLSPEAKAAIKTVNSINIAKHDLSQPIEHRPGIFLLIEFISMHLLRNPDIIDSALCGHDPSLTSSPFPPIPW